MKAFTHKSECSLIYKPTSNANWHFKTFFQVDWTLQLWCLHTIRFGLYLPFCKCLSHLNFYFFFASVRSTLKTYTWTSKSVSYRFIGIHVTSSATIDEWGGISHQHVMIGHLERLDWCVKDLIKTSQGLIQSLPINTPLHCPSLYVKLNSLANQVPFFFKQMHQFRSSSAYRLCLNNLLSNW